MPYERPETWVTFRTGHMGYTFRFLQAGGVDAVESESGHLAEHKEDRTSLSK